MAKNNKGTGLHRRDAIKGLAMTGIGAGLWSQTSHSQSKEPWTTDCEKGQYFKPSKYTILTAPLYGRDYGIIDLISADYGPRWNDKTEEVVPGKSPNRNVTLYGRDLPAGTDFGGHYHKDEELIYCPHGQIKVIIRENTGKPAKTGAGKVEMRHPDALKMVDDGKGGKKAARNAIVEYKASETYIPKLPGLEFGLYKKNVIEIPLTNEPREIILERGGSIVIPSLCYHSVIIPEKSESGFDAADMVAYLPDGDRYASDTYPGNK